MDNKQMMVTKRKTLDAGKSVDKKNIHCLRKQDLFLIINFLSVSTFYSSGR